MQIIPLQPLPSQDITVQLDDQTCQISVYQKSTGLYLNLSVNNALIIGGVLAENLNRMVRSAYLGFVGDLVFMDNQGTSDPDYTDLGSRYSLAYLESADLEAAES